MSNNGLEDSRFKLEHLFFCLGIFHFVAGLIQIHFLPVVSLGTGTGYDGIWYIRKATNLASRVDDYHLFRILPSYICYFALDILGLEKNWPNGILVFQYMNLLAIQGFVWLAFRMSKALDLTMKEGLLLALFSLFNFNFTREAYYNPVMTDTLAATLSMGLFVAHLEKRNWLKFVFGLPMIFTFPFAVMVFLVFNFFKPFDTTAVSGKLKPLILVGIVAAFLVPSLIWFYYMGRVTIYTFPR